MAESARPTVDRCSNTQKNAAVAASSNACTGTGPTVPWPIERNRGEKPV